MAAADWSPAHLHSARRFLGSSDHPLAPLCPHVPLKGLSYRPTLPAGRQQRMADLGPVQAAIPKALVALERKQELERQLAQLPPGAQERQSIERKLGHANQQVTTLWAIILQWALTYDGVQQPGAELVAMDGEAAWFMLSGVAELVDIEAKHAEIRSRLDFAAWPGFSLHWSVMPRTVRLCVYGWPSALLSWIGFPPYSSGMRTTLGLAAVALWAEVACFGWNPKLLSAALAAASVVSMHVLEKDLQQREQDLDQLHRSWTRAQQLAGNASPFLASLATAIARELPDTWVHAAAAQQAVWEPPHVALGSCHQLHRASASTLQGS